MSEIVRFDDLPNEMIICVFNYLKATENFHSFFNYNNRLRKLVKQYVRFSRLQLQNDMKQFFELHSSYKHFNFINDDGHVFYLIPFQAEFNCNDIHWHFSRAKPISTPDQRIGEIIEKYSIRFNPLGQIFSSEFQCFIHRHYSFQYQYLKTILVNSIDQGCFQFPSNITDDLHSHLDFIFENEQTHLTNRIFNAADHIWKDLQQIEDLNLLNIKYCL